MDVSAACSGFVYAYSAAQAYITSGMARNVLVIGAELLTRFLDYTDRNTCILFGDGAGAVVLSAATQPGGGLGIELTTEPQGAYMIWLPAGGAKSPPSAETVRRGEHFVRMEGRETYRFATRTLASTALAAVDKAGLKPSDIDLFIPHQANIRIIQSVADGLGLPMDKMFVNLDKYGNTSAASIPIALAEAVDSGRVNVGDHIVIVAFGAGFTSGAVAIEWTADPSRGALAESIRAEDVRVRLPVDWDSVDPIPAALAEILARPVGPGVELDLEDVVPGEPDHAPNRTEVHA
jgi:3-oxoacyl-[acyl-carrier-protein] synthase-3